MAVHRIGAFRRGKYTGIHNGGKFISAKTADSNGVWENFFQDAPHFRQHVVAAGMAVVIVDELKFVEIGDEHDKRPLRPAGRETELCAFLERGFCENPGEGICLEKLLEALVREIQLPVLQKHINRMAAVCYGYGSRCKR